LLATIGWVIAYRDMAAHSGSLFYIAVATLAEKQVKFPQEIAFNEDGIIINTIPKREYAWSALSNVVLKDNILTDRF
jgi:hypothetical protein